MNAHNGNDTILIVADIELEVRFSSIQKDICIIGGTNTDGSPKWKIENNMSGLHSK